MYSHGDKVHTNKWEENEVIIRLQENKDGDWLHRFSEQEQMYPSLMTSSLNWLLTSSVLPWQVFSGILVSSPHPLCIVRALPEAEKYNWHRHIEHDVIVTKLLCMVTKPIPWMNEWKKEAEGLITQIYSRISLWGLGIRKLVSFKKLWLFAAAPVVIITDISFWYQFKSILWCFVVAKASKL